MRESAAYPARAPARDGDAAAGRTTVVILASLGAHLAFAGVLGVLPGTSSMLATAPIAIEMSFPTEVAPIEATAPEVVPEPEPVAEPEVVPQPVPVARTERPRPVPQAEPEPEVVPPPPAAIGPAPPSLDEVFGDPAPPLETMGAAGGGFAIAPGAPGGRAGGVPGGTGTGVGGGGSGVGAAAATGPSTAEIRRARRAYTDRIEGLLRQHARYPIAARAQQLGGRVALALRIGEDGRLLAARVVGSCGYAMLDAAALETVNGIASFPRPPTLVPWDPREELRTSLVYQVTR